MTYNDMIETRRIQILKSALPYLSTSSQRPVAMMIQFFEFLNASETFKDPNNSMAALSLPDPSKRRSAMLTAIREHATKSEQETIDNILNILCVMDNFGENNGCI